MSSSDFDSTASEVDASSEISAAGTPTTFAKPLTTRLALSSFDE